MLPYTSIIRRLLVLYERLLVKTDTNGVLQEAYRCGNQALFKGIFVRYVHYFIDGTAFCAECAIPVAKLARWRGFLATNAESLWRSQGPEGAFPLWWGAGTPPVFPTAAVNLQMAAIDAFVAASSLSRSSSSSPVLSGRSSAPVECNGAGEKVRDRCVCRTRFVGADCQQEVSWLKYFSTWMGLGRSVVIMTSTSHFISSPSAVADVPGSSDVCAVSHVTGDEAWTVESCGTDGVGLVDSRGRWLALDADGVNGSVAAMTTVNQSAVNCSDPESPAAFQLPPTVLYNNSDTDEAVQLISKVRTGNQGSTAWYVAADSTAGAGGESLVAVAMNTEHATNITHGESRLWFHVRLQDHCQTLV